MTVELQKALNYTLFRTLIGMAPDGIIVIDALGMVKLYNAACEKLFRYSADEVVGKNVKMLMPSPYHEAHDGYLSRYESTGEKRIIGIGREVTGLRKDGSTFPMYLSIGEGKLEDDKTYIGIIHDLTEQKEAEKALLERGARLSSILETGPDAIIVISETGTIESVNSATTRLFGYSREALVGQNVKILMPSPFHEEHDGYLRRYRTTGEKRIIGIGRVVEGKHRDGSTFPLELAVGEVHVGKQRFFTGFIRDISERTAAERRLQQLQFELLHVSRLSDMTQMVAALAHELNQPLTAIMNYVKAARRTAGAATDPNAKKTLELIDKATQQTARAGQIILRLRSFIEKRETIRSEEKIDKVIEEAIALGFMNAVDLKVRIQLEFAAGLPPVYIDKIQIQQVAINLIRNAIEAMRSVSRRELTIGAALNEENFVEVAIADTGPGLSPEVAARLFQPFVTTKEKGMGIGLTICQSIIESHNGRIWATANEGGGVVFRFVLPPPRPE